MIKVVFLESEHFAWILMMLIDSFQVLFRIAEILSIFVGYIGGGSFFLYDFCSYIRVVVSLGRGVLHVESFVGL
jgi:hypothetical protein